MATKIGFLEVAIWEDCAGVEHIRPLQATATRIVESQEQVATTILVDTLDEQYMLEKLLDASKPAPPAGAEAYHYLIWTPFRYPPLAHGSRFGQRMQAGLFYASLTLETVLAECAYYRFVFLSGLAVPLPRDRLTTAHNTFEVRVATDRGLRLNAAPFDQYVGAISHPAQYHASQSLGAAMREAHVEGFTYTSARDTRAGANIALFALSAIKTHQAKRLRQWLCTTTTQAVSFVEVHSNQPPYHFPLAPLLVNGRLPAPAC